MKKFLLLALSCYTFNANLKAQQLENCNELFITEILTVPNIALNGQQSITESVEIFNPTSNSINLSNYSLELISSTSAPINILLSGSITAKSTYVISGAKSFSTVANNSNKIDVNLTFTKYVGLKLKKNSATIDAFGEPSTAVLNMSNLLQFQSDPVTYCSVKKIALNSLQNVSLRRSMLTQKGDTSFCSSTGFLGNWSMDPGNDFTHLNYYLGTCNITANSSPIIGYSITSFTINESVSAGSNLAMLGLTWSNAGAFPTYVSRQDFISGNAVVNQDMYFTAGSAPTNCQIVDNSPLNCTDVRTSGNLFVGTKNTVVELKSQNNDFTIDPAKSKVYITIKGNKPSGIEEKSILLDVSLYPNPAKNEIHVKTKTIGNYIIYNSLGMEVKKDEYKQDFLLNISDLSEGVYSIILYNSDGKLTQKLIKQN